MTTLPGFTDAGPELVCEFTWRGNLMHSQEGTGRTPHHSAWKIPTDPGRTLAVYDFTDPAAPRLVAVRDVDACEAMERFFEWMQWCDDVENGDAR